MLGGSKGEPEGGLGELLGGSGGAIAPPSRVYVGRDLGGSGGANPQLTFSFSLE